MQITRLELENFRGFEKFEIDLHPEMTLLVGENGSGKSALIDALAFAAAKQLQGLPVAQMPDPATRDRRVSVRTVGGVPTLEPERPLRIEWTGTFLGKAYGLRWIDGQDGRDWARAFPAGIDLRNRVTAGEPLPLPLIARLEASKGWERNPRAGEVQPANRLAGYSDWHSPRASQTQLVSWLRKYTFVELQEKAPAPHLRAVVRAIRDAVPGTIDVGFNVRADEVWVTFEGDRIVPFSLLSDGYRSMVALVADLAWRAAVLNPQLEDRAARETEGIVLIDEIELHLHPRWQRQVLGALRRAFPKLQFVVTTHSPQVIASAKREWVRLLDGTSTAKTPEFVEGRDPNGILEDIFGVSGRPEETLDRIRTIFEAVDRGDVSGARAILEELEAVLGPDDPDMVRARWMLDVEAA